MNYNKIFYLVLILLGTSIFISCRKGDEDPFISFRSRDARITAEWKLIKFESVRTTSNTSGSSQVTTSNYNGSFITSSIENSEPRAYTLVLNIKTDGTCQVDEDGANKSSSAGRWFWLNTAQRKTDISINSFGDYTNVFDGGTYEVLGLRNSELTLKSYYKRSYNSGSSNGSNNEEYKATYTFEKK
jgi:hypothetical protein